MLQTAGQANIGRDLSLIPPQGETEAILRARLVSRLFECDSEPMLGIGPIDFGDRETQAPNCSRDIACGQFQACPQQLALGISGKFLPKIVDVNASLLRPARIEQKCSLEKSDPGRQRTRG